MNKVILTGRTTKELELKTTQGGTSVVRFTLAVERRKKDDDADFVSCVAYGKIAEAMVRYVRKGHKIGMVGHILTGKYEKNGVTIYTSDVVLDEMEFLENKKTEAEKSGPEKDVTVADLVISDDADLPF